MALALRFAARSDVGLVREGNEDSGIATAQVLAVADGMGGHAAGEVASSLTVHALAGLADHQSGDPRELLIRALREANARIRAAVEADPSREGMGTTVTAVVPAGDDVVLAHVGDSRAYLLRHSELRQLTHDHTYVQGLVDEGRITADEAQSHPARSLILRTLDGRADPDLDVEMLHVQPGDRLLLCSDGLSGVVSDDTLRDALAAGDDLGAIAESLVELALKGGAPDNVTVVVAEVTEADSGESLDARPVVVGAAADTEDPPEPSPHRREGLLRRRSSAAGRAAALGTGTAPPMTAGTGSAATAPAAAGTATATEEPLDEEALRYAPRPPRRFRRLRWALAALVLLSLLAAAAAWALDWSQRQYFVAASGDQVAIYRGLSQEVGGANINEVAEVSGDLPVAALPEVYQEQLADTIAADDLEDARAIVDRLREAACAAALPDSRPVTRTPARSPAPTAGRTPSPSPAAAQATPQATPTRTPTPRASPTPSPTPQLPAGLDCTGTDAASRATTAASTP